MKDYKPTTRTFSESIPVTEVTDTNHADNINAAPKQLIENDLYLKEKMENVPGWTTKFQPDTTLTASGEAADAAVVGKNLERAFREIDGVEQAVNLSAGEVSELKTYVGLTDDDIYGVEVDFVNKTFTRLAGAVGKSAGGDFSSIQAFGGRKRCCVTDDGNVVAYEGESGFSSSGSLTQVVTAWNGQGYTGFGIGTSVQVMVEQPKFYYKVVPLLVEKRKKGGVTRKVRYYVSDTPKDGFKLHPAFIKNGKEKNKIYMSAFEASVYDYSEGKYIKDDREDGTSEYTYTEDMLCSIGGVKPASGANYGPSIDDYRTMAHNRGNGWEQAYAATYSASQLLMLIEYASFNMQDAIGDGVVFKDDIDGVNIAENTGATLICRDYSGSFINENGHTCVTYRGEENLWGNAFHYVDGMSVSKTYYDIEPSSTAETTLFIADHAFSDPIDGVIGDSYEDAGVSIPYGEGYISAFCWSEEYDWLFVPGELSGDSNLPVGDYCWNCNVGSYVVRIGGAWWSPQQTSGAFGWLFDGLIGFGYHHNGARLVYIPLVTEEDV